MSGHWSASSDTAAPEIYYSQPTKINCQRSLIILFLVILLQLVTNCIIKS